MKDKLNKIKKELFEIISSLPEKEENTKIVITQCAESLDWQYDLYGIDSLVKSLKLFVKNANKYKKWKKETHNFYMSQGAVDAYYKAGQLLRKVWINEK